MENHFNPELYYKKEKIIDLKEANQRALIIILPIFLTYLVLFLVFNPSYLSLSFIKEKLSTFVNEFSIWKFLLFSIIFMFGIVVHELIHGITWAVFAKGGFKAIKFGYLKETATPYCHCKEPLLVKHYIWGGVMPGILMGILPALVAVFIGDIPLLLFATFYTSAAIGDYMIVELIWKENPNSYVQDHPSAGGCYVFERK